MLVEEKQLDDNSFILDFIVRWNTTNKMLDKVFILKEVYIDLTTNPEMINDIKVFILFCFFFCDS